MAPRARSPTSLRVDGGRRCGSALGRVGGDEFSVFAPLGPRCTASIGVASAPRDAKTLHDLRLKADLALHAAKEQGGNTGLTPSDEMVLKSSYYGRAQLARVKALAERQRTKGGDPAARGAR